MPPMMDILFRCLRRGARTAERHAACQTVTMAISPSTKTLWLLCQNAYHRATITFPLAELIGIDPNKKQNLRPIFLLGHVLEAIRTAATGETRDIHPDFSYELCTNLNTIKEWLDDTFPLESVR